MRAWHRQLWRGLSQSSKSNEFVEGYSSGIKIYCPLSRKSVHLRSRRPRILTWYACGPTVYDSAHIGHASCYMKQDLVRRALEGMFGIQVTMAMSVTDIDDKILARAREEGVSISSITSRYEREFFSDMDHLRILPPLVKCRVSKNISSITNFVQQLINDGHAYPTSDGSVYFRLASCKNYGKLGAAGDSASREASGAHDYGKEDERDWAVWKGAKEGEPSWQSPWGPGRPGWHVECSAMGSSLFGNHVDIHSGGVDLAFPHHENEEAQSCCFHKVDHWVSHWLHFGHLNLKGDIKMSKSLKNTISIGDFLNNYNADHMRMLCLLTKYRNGIEFSDDAIENAVAVCNKFTNFFDDCQSYLQGVGFFGEVQESEILKLIDEVDKDIKFAIADNFDFSKATSRLLHLVSITNTMLHSKAIVKSSTSPVAVMAASTFVSKYLELFGLSLNQKGMMLKDDVNWDSILDTAIGFRSQIRSTALTLSNNQDLKVLKGNLLGQCDKFRTDLADQGVLLKDLGETSKWSVQK